MTTQQQPRKRAPGGGRKPLAPGGMVRKTITLSAEDWRYLATLDGNTSAAVRLLVERHREDSANVLNR